VVDDQHKLISGYRDLTVDEIRVMNLVKSLEREFGELWQRVRDDVPDADPRCLSVARTTAQDAFMWFVRAVTRPDDPFDQRASAS
jgi:hypothetical protein